MPATINQDRLVRQQQYWHPRCAVCAPANLEGLGLAFCARADGSVEAEFTNLPKHQGYEGMQHGGITAALLDSAMTNCLFAAGIAGVTGELTVRYRHPIQIGASMRVRAWRERSLGAYHMLAAEIWQAGLIVAQARSKFMAVKNQAE